MSITRHRQASYSVLSGHQLRKKLSASHTQSDFKIKPGFLYTQVRAISARVNQNYDGWPSEELKKAAHTFVGKPVFVNHANENPELARGVIVASRYLESGQDKYIEVIQEVDAQRFPKLAKELREGGLDSVSMGAEAGFTICSICNNHATNEVNMCDHVRYHKGEFLPGKSGEPELVYESCHDLKFFELSYVFDPADETAVVSKVAFGEVEAPEAIDTLRDDDGSEFDDFHNYVEPPKELQAPDLEKVQELDRRQEEMGLDEDRRVEDVQNLRGSFVLQSSHSQSQRTQSNDHVLDGTETTSRRKVVKRNTANRRKRSVHNSVPRGRRTANPVKVANWYEDAPGEHSFDGGQEMGYGAVFAPGHPENEHPQQHKWEVGEGGAYGGPHASGFAPDLPSAQQAAQQAYGKMPNFDQKYLGGKKQAGGFPVDVTDESEDTQDFPADLPPVGDVPPVVDDQGFDDSSVVDTQILSDEEILDTLDALEDEAELRGLPVDDGFEGDQVFEEYPAEDGATPFENEAPIPSSSDQEEPQIKSFSSSRQRRADDQGGLGRNDQGPAEDAFITQTPPEEGVVDPVKGDTPISNTEQNLVAKLKSSETQLLKDAEAYKNFKMVQKASQISKLKTIAEIHPDQAVRRKARTLLAQETADVVNPAISGTDDQSLKGDDFEALDCTTSVETQPKDASRNAFDHFNAWVKKTTGRSVTQIRDANVVKRLAQKYASTKKVSTQSLFPHLGAVLRDIRTANENLDVAAPQGRTDVEAPTSNTTDEYAQESQFDDSGYAQNAGDPIADPDLSTDQNWAPGTKSSKKADGVAAVRCAEAHIAAGLEPEERKWVLAAQFQTMSAGMVKHTTRLLERVAASREAERANQRRTAASGGNRGARQLPQGIGSGIGKTSQTTRVAANDPSNDALLYL